MTPVTLSGALLAAVLGCGLLTTAPPAAADPSSDPVSGLVGDLVGDLVGGPQDPPRDGAHERRARRDHGHTRARDGRLRRGCHDYAYRYRLKIRTDDWTLETFLRDPSRETIASGAYTSDADPKRARAHFRFCRYTTEPGRFTIRAKLTFYNASGEHRTWLEPSHFRLRRR